MHFHAIFALNSTLNLMTPRTPMNHHAYATLTRPIYSALFPFHISNIKLYSTVKSTSLNCELQK